MPAHWFLRAWWLLKLCSGLGVQLTKEDGRKSTQLRPPCSVPHSEPAEASGKAHPGFESGSATNMLRGHGNPEALGRSQHREELCICFTRAVSEVHFRDLAHGLGSARVPQKAACAWEPEPPLSPAQPITRAAYVSQSFLRK